MSFRSTILVWLVFTFQYQKAVNGTKVKCHPSNNHHTQMHITISKYCCVPVYDLPLISPGASVRHRRPGQDPVPGVGDADSRILAHHIQHSLVSRRSRHLLRRAVQRNGHHLRQAGSVRFTIYDRQGQCRSTAEPQKHGIGSPTQVL